MRYKYGMGDDGRAVAWYVHVVGWIKACLDGLISGICEYCSLTLPLGCLEGRNQNCQLHTRACARETGSLEPQGRQ